MYAHVECVSVCSRACVFVCALATILLLLPFLLLLFSRIKRLPGIVALKLCDPYS